VTARTGRFAKLVTAAGGTVTDTVASPGWMGFPAAAATGNTAVIWTLTRSGLEGKRQVYARLAVAARWLVGCGPEADAAPAAIPLAASIATSAMARATVLGARSAVLGDRFMRGCRR
jgi:hypothetical protein